MTAAETWFSLAISSSVDSCRARFLADQLGDLRVGLLQDSWLISFRLQRPPRILAICNGITLR